MLALPVAQTVEENGTLSFSSLSANQVSLSDADSEGHAEQVTLKDSHGTLAFGATVGLESVSGEGSGEVVATGPVSAIDEALETLAYTPAHDYQGEDTLEADANDLGHTGAGGPLTANGSVAISIMPVRYDTAEADSYKAVEDQTLETAAPGLLGNDVDTDVPALPLEVLEVTAQPVHGTVSVNPDGSFTYTPNHLEAGSDSFSYTDTDGNTESNEATVTIEVESQVFDTAVNDSYTVDEGEVLEVSTPGVLGNDTDSEGLALEAELVKSTSEGTLSLEADGSFRYEPNPGFSGSDSFTYRANDGNTPSNEATVTIEVRHVNKAPSVSAPGAQTLEENSTLAFSEAESNALSIADADSEGEPEQVTLKDSHGTLALGGTTGLESVTGEGSGEVVAKGPVTALDEALEGLLYTPTHDYHGEDTLKVEADDLGNSGVGGPLTASGSVTITVTPVVYDEAVDDSYNTKEDETLVVAAPGLLGNDVDSDTPELPLKASVVKSPSHGTLTLAATGSFEYEPESGFHGTDSFTYKDDDGNTESNVATVTLTVEQVPAPALSGIESGALSYTSGAEPVAVTSTLEAADAKSTTLSGATVAISSGLSPGDVLGFVNTAKITGSYDVATGVLTLSGEASLAEYEAALRSVTFSTKDGTESPAQRTVSFVVDDGLGTNETSNTVSRTISVAAAPPVLSSIEAAALEYVAGEPGVAVTSTLAVSDLKSTTLSGATVTISAGFASGQDVLAFASTAKITGSYEGATGALTLSGEASLAEYESALRSVTYEDTEPIAPTTGKRTVSFQVQDGGATDSSSNALSREVSVTAEPPPVLSSVESSALSYTSGGAPVAVTASLEVSDERSSQLTEATVTISSGLSSTDVLGFVSTAKITGSYEGATGVLTLNGEASLAEYEAALRSVTFSSEDGSESPAQRTVSFVVSDGKTSHPSSNAVSRTISVEAAPPVLSSIESSLLEYEAGTTPVAVTSSIEASDLKSENLTSATVSVTSGFVSGQDVLAFASTAKITGSYGAATGVLTLSGEASLAEYEAALRSVTYEDTEATSPTTGKRTISFQVQDGGATDFASNTVSREVEVLQPSFAPEAEPDSYTAQANTTLGVGTTPAAPALDVSGSVLENDSNPNTAKTALTATAGTSSEQGGTVAMNSDGTFTYLPPVGFTGKDSFKYTVDDNEPRPKTAEGTVEITVEGPVVWYVDDSKISGDGRSSSPLAALSEAEADGKAGDVIFLFKGSGSYGGGYAMRSSQRLVGQSAGLEVSGHVLASAEGTNPVVTNAAGAGVTLAEEASVEGLTVEGTSGAGVRAISVGQFNVASDVKIAKAGGAAFEVSGGSGAATSEASIESESGHSVYVTGREGGTLTIAGPVTDEGSGVLLTSNSGASIAFTGTLHLSTGANAALEATEGGTVTATGSGSTIATTTGRPLTVSNTTIGSEGLSFKSISAGTSTTGPAVGIDLTSTGSEGGLTVSGAGSTGSGGTIENTTGKETGDADVTLSNTGPVSLTDMTLTGKSETAGSGVYAVNASSLKLLSDTIENHTVTGIQSEWTESDSGTFEMKADTLLGQQGSAIQVENRGSGTVTGHLLEDTIGSESVSDSGSSAGEGMKLGVEGSGTLTADVSSNKVNRVESSYGIEAGELSGAGTLNLTLSENYVKMENESTSEDAITVGSKSESGLVCLHATKNTGIGANPTFAGTGAVGMSVIQEAPSSRFEIQGYTGSPTSEEAVDAFLEAENPGLKGPGGNTWAELQLGNTNGFTNATCATAP